MKSSLDLDCFVMVLFSFTSKDYLVFSLDCVSYVSYFVYIVMPPATLAEVALIPSLILLCPPYGY